MANVKNVTINKELVNKLCSIIKGYDPYTAYIEDYKQYSNAVDNNCKLDQQFIHTCNEYGYNVGVSFCYSLAKSLASGKFDSAEETVVNYINSLTKEDDSILSSPNITLENNDNANKEGIAMKKNTNINNATIEVKEESTMTNEMIKDEVKVVSTTLTQENGELTFVELSPEQKIQISAVLDAQLQDVNYSSWFEEENGIFKLYTAWVDEDPTVEEEYCFDKNNKLIKVEVEKEETTMIANNTTNNVTINNNTNIKEETIMKTRTTQELINDALNISKIQDENYVTNAMLREEYKKLTGNVIGSNKTRPVIIKAIQDELHKEPAKPAPDDAKVLTYRLMHKIGDHALSNRKKGFGTTVSAWMLCAYILKVKYGMTYLKGHEHEVTDEMKETVKDVRNWLLNHRYIKPVTFKDEKGFIFYTPEYDGNRKDKMYDCTKFRATGKVETTTYMVTKEMNKWYK